MTVASTCLQEKAATYGHLTQNALHNMHCQTIQGGYCASSKQHNIPGEGLSTGGGDGDGEGGRGDGDGDGRGEGDGDDNGDGDGGRGDGDGEEGLGDGDGEEGLGDGDGLGLPVFRGMKQDPEGSLPPTSLVPPGHW